MSDAPSTCKYLRFPLNLIVFLSALAFCLLGFGAWKVFTWRYAVPPPEAVKVKPRAAIGVIRAEPQAKPQEPEMQDGSQRRTQPRRAPLSHAEYLLGYECYEHVHKKIKEDLMGNLAGDYPELSDLLSINYPQPDPKIVQALLQRLLEAAKNAPMDRKPSLLLAADEVAGRLALPFEVPPSPGLQRQLNELAAQGVTYKWAELDGGWTYQSDLLWLLWRDYANTEPGEDAFVLLLRRGWDTTSCCGKGSDNFRNVVREGEQFLAQRPQSPHRVEVVFLLAQAYETWWSLSLAPEQNPEEGDPAPEPYREGASAAHEKAITYYEEIVQAAAESPEANCSSKPLAQLKENQDTHQRRFFCYCD